MKAKFLQAISYIAVFGIIWAGLLWQCPNQASAANRGRGKAPKEVSTPASLIEIKWMAFKSALENEDPEESSESRFNELMGTRVSTGTRNLFEHSAALISMASVSLKAGKREEASAQLAWAIELSPDYPAPKFAMARFKLLDGKIGAALGYASEGLGSLSASYKVSLPLRAKITYSLFGSLLLLPLVFAAGVIARKWKLVAYDVDETFAWLPIGTSVPLTLAFILLPLVILGSLAYYSLLIPVLLWMYLQKWERFTAILLVICLIMAPFLLSSLSKSIARSSNMTLAAALNIREGISTKEDVSFISNVLSGEKGDKIPGASELKFLLAGAFKRLGDVEHAKEIYIKLTGEQNSEYGAKAMNNLGVADFDNGDYKKAATRFKKAKEDLPQAVEPRFNLGMSHYKNGDTTLGDEELQQARSMDRKALDAMADQAGSSKRKNLAGGTRTVDMTLSNKEFQRLIQSIRPEPSQRLGSDIWSMWVSKRFGTNTVFPFLIIVILAAIILEVLRQGQKFIFAVNCSSCGEIFRLDDPLEVGHNATKPATRRTKGDIDDPQGLCRRCSSATGVASSGIDPRTKLQVLAEARNYQSRSANIGMVASIIFPGLGEFLRGKAVRGTILAFLAIFLGMMIMGFKPNPVSHLTKVSFANNVNLIFFSIFYIMLVVISAWDARSKR